MNPVTSRTASLKIWLRDQSLYAGGNIDLTIFDASSITTMNDFLAGCGISPEIQTRAAHLFSQLRCKRMETRIQQGSRSFIFNYSQSKVIDDIYVRDDASASWLCVLGMPLIESDSDDARKNLLREFLQNPRHVICSELDGHFALFAFDAYQNRLIVATDINSFIPIYYAQTDDGVLFSSSDLLLARLLHKSFSPLGLSQAVNLGSTWGPISRFLDISKLQASELAVVTEERRITKEKYWEPNEENIWQGGFKSVLDSWMETLRGSVLKFHRHSRHSTISSDLTAGEDSRLIVSQLQNLGLEYSLRVSGSPSDIDVKLASRYAAALGLKLSVHTPGELNLDSILNNTLTISTANDGYGSWFNSSARFGMLARNPPLELKSLHFSGVPGGEVFRGTYYLRAGLLSPSKRERLDYRLLARLKFLLDFVPGLLKYDDEMFIDSIRTTLDSSIDDVHLFPVGTQVDHVLRSFQVALMGCWSFPQRQPFYWPLGLKEMTKSIYNVPPEFKARSKLSRAATEKLFPALARMRTDDNIPTLRQTAFRFPLFIPGYYTTAKKVVLGGVRRVAHFKQGSSTLAMRHRIDLHGPIMMVLLNSPPYAKWLRSTSDMITGEWYSGEALDKMLNDAKVGKCDRVEVLGRIINQELAARFLDGETTAT